MFRDQSGRIVVRLFKAPSAEQIEDLSMPVLFILRAIVQLGLATELEVMAATQLPRSDVDDAIRFCVSRGYVEAHEGAFRMTWDWYRTVTTVLQRQHLLSSR